MTSPDSFIALQEALLGRYSIERELGRGGMGTVYLARDIRLDRPVAIKVLHESLAASAAERERFLREARTAAALSHPNIVPIFSVETREPFVYLVMEYVVGETLAARINQRGPLRAEDAERMIRDVAWALGYAHAHGVIHRDITLANILLERGSGRALLVDFGLAGQADDEAGAPRFGTPGFLAPEVIRGEAATPQSDLYSLGVVAWTALCGRAPFDGPTPGQLLARHLVQAVPSLAAQVRGVSRRKCTAIEQSLAKDPESRPDATGGFLAMLDRAPELLTLAPPLQGWFRRWDRIAPVYSAITPPLALLTFSLAQIYYTRRPNGSLLLAAMIIGAASLTLIPLAIQSLFEIVALRRLRADGFGVDDIRTGLPHYLEQLKIEREREGLRPLSSRVITDLTVIGAITTVVTLFLITPFFMPDASEASRWAILRRGLDGAAPGLYLVTMIGVSIMFVSPGYRPKAHGILRRVVTRFWNSSIAATLGRLAGMAQERGEAAGTLHRPTALVLGLAIEDLWRAMPGPLREGLGDVSALAKTLQANAIELRELLDRVQASEQSAATTIPDHAVVSEAHRTLELRHRETVATLERLRLHLLRLVATRQQTAELTQHLHAARELEEVLLREVAGHDEVRRLLGRRRGQQRTPSSTPTPQTA